MDFLSGRYVFDIETNDLLHNLKKIHCVGFSDYEDYNVVYILTDYELMKHFFQHAKFIICHNLINFDLEVIKRILGVDYAGEKIDTLALSMYLYCRERLHRLDHYGKLFGLKKPEVEDWEEQPLEVYINRVAEDVRINNYTTKYLLTYLMEIYKDQGDIRGIINMINFKMECEKEQTQNPIKIDMKKIHEYQKEWSAIVEEKRKILMEVMPKIQQKVRYKKPKHMTKADGSLSAHGERWLERLASLGLPSDHEEDISVLVDKWKEPNPNSYDQLKDWLYSLGWDPCTYKYRKKKDGSRSKNPQIAEEGELYPSVQKLAEDYPEILELANYSIYRNRLNFIENIIEAVDENGYASAGISGFTNTLRFKHRKPFANIPKNKKMLGAEIRSLFIAPEGYEVIGSDVTGLESATADHYIYFYDPKYVEERRQGDYDSHTDIAVLANIMTKDEEKFYKWFEEEKDVEPIRLTENPTTFEEMIELSKEEQLGFYKFQEEKRNDAKLVNFSAIYGVGAETLARQMKKTVQFTKNLLEIYWKRNWAVKVIGEKTLIKNVRGQDWLYNPVSNFWYELRYKKDAFSTLNQGTGAYIFDLWVYFSRKMGMKLRGQFHDELIIYSKNSKKDCELLVKAMDQVNEKLKLNVEITIDTKVGSNYSRVH